MPDAGRSRHRSNAALAVTLTLAALAACASAPGRDEARDDLIEQLVGRGLPSAIAECVVDRFFAAHSDSELREFYDRDELSDEEIEEFTTFGADCGA